MNHSKDRCGTKQFPKWLRVILSQNYNEACAIHDEDYKNKVISRKQADEDFLAIMLTKAGGRFWLKAEAYLLYYSVRFFGWIFY